MLRYSKCVPRAFERRCTALGASHQHASRDHLHTYSHICAQQGRNAATLRVDQSPICRVWGHTCQIRRYSTSDDEKERLKMAFENALLMSHTPFLTKFFQLLPGPEQTELRLFSDSLKSGRSTSAHLMNMYSMLRKNDLHRYLTIRAMKRLMRRVACDAEPHGGHSKTQARIIVSLLEDHSMLGFAPGVPEYASLIRALALERGREKEALQLLDSVIESSEMAPFIRPLKGKRDTTSSVADRIPTDEEIERIEAHLQKAEEAAAIEEDGNTEEDLDAMARILSDTDDPDQMQALVIEQRRARHQQDVGKIRSRPLHMSRDFYHMAMRGFAQIYHIRGVMEILGRMLELGAQMPYRIARYVIPNKVTWEIVGDVMSRQRDRPTFVKLWVEFLSRGARPPLSLTQKLVRLLVHQMCIEQAIWVMRISRCLPDMGDKLPRAPYAADKVPWDLKVRIMHVASALQVATSLNTTPLGHEEALRQGRAAMQLPQLEKPDPDIYSRLIGGAVRMKSEKLAERLFRELVEAGVAPPGAVYARLAEMYADRNQISRVFLIVRGMLAIHHYKITKEKLEDGTLANVSRARRKAVLARKLAMLQVDLECIVPLLRFYVQENREDETMALLQSWDMLYKDRVPTEKLVAALLKVYNRPEDTSSASSLLHTLVSRLNSERGDKDDGSEAAEREPAQTAQAARGADAATILLAHSQAIQTHLRARNIPGVVQVLREILDGDLQPPYKIWEMVMRGFLQEHALDLFDTVHAFLRDTLKVPLSLPMYSLWMRSLHGHGDVGGVQAAFDEMVELGQIPTQQHYLTLVLAYAHRGLLDQAVGIVHNLRKPNSALRPGVMLEAAVVEAHAACGEMAEAEAELRRLMDTTHLPPSSIPAHPFNALIIGHLRSGHGAKAIRVYTEMMRLGVKPDVYTFSILMYSYAKAKHVKNCLRVFSEMARMGVVPTIVTYTILIFAFSTAKLFSRADKVFDHIIQEQNWARAQVESRNLFMAGGSIPSSSPDILDMYAAPSRFSQWDVGEQLTDDEHIRIRSFYNLNPVVYIVMLSMYRRSRRTMWALATWERFMKNFPIVQWNPREGGITSKTLYHTSNFHLIAWTLVLRTVTKAVRAPLLFSQPHRHVDYFTEPLHSRVIRMRLDRRQQQKLNLQYLASRWPNDGRIQDLRKRMLRRRHIVGDVEKEIDARLDADFEFCRQQRFEQRLPKLEDQLHFNGYRYWMPNYTDLARLRIIPDGRMVHATVPIPLFKKRLRPNSPPKLSTTGEPLSPLFKEKGRFVNPTVQGMASILSKQWRALEEGQFMFNNIHVSVYLPIVIVGRQYEDLIHFLLQVQPRAASRKATEDPDHPKEYRYRKIHVDPRTTRMLTRQIRIVCGMMLAERDRRVLLTALLDTDSNLHDIYTHGSTFRGPMVERTANVLRVMRERLVIHCEREISWARELDTLRYIASLWVPLIGAEPRNELKEMLEMIEEVPR